MGIDGAAELALVAGRDPDSDAGAFGSHQGGHPEGLDHVWLQSASETTVTSWAAGKVTRIEDCGADGLQIIIDYGHGLIGRHMSIVRSPLHVGDTVKEGGPVGTGAGITAEFTLMDQNRCDGVLGQVDGYSYVSPFDYLRPEAQAALLARYQAEVVAPFLSVGRSAPTATPWEPWLTNRTLFHSDHAGTAVGEWVLVNKGWSTPDPSYFDILTIEDVSNRWGHFTTFGAGDDDSSKPGYKTDAAGTWSVSEGGKIHFQTAWAGPPEWFGLYQIDESGPRSRLTLEWSPTAYPTSLSPAAAIYEARLNVYRRLDAALSRQ